LLGICARTVLPRSRHTAANDDAVRVLAPVDTVREVRESSRRAVVHARLLGASPPTRLFKSKQKRVRKGDDTGSRWIQTLSYNSRNGGTLLTLFADCQLVSRIFSPRCLCVARCFGKNLWGALSVAGVPLEVYNTHARPHRRRSSLALGRARGEHAGSYPSGEGSNGGKARG
jgi:hypothetical protein